MSKLKVDNFYQVFNVGVIFIISHNKKVDISMDIYLKNTINIFTRIDFYNII